MNSTKYLQVVNLLFLRVFEFRALTAISSRQIFYSSLYELNVRKTEVVLGKTSEDLQDQGAKCWL